MENEIFTPNIPNTYMAVNGSDDLYEVIDNHGAATFRFLSYFGGDLLKMLDSVESA